MAGSGKERGGGRREEDKGVGRAEKGLGKKGKKGRREEEDVLYVCQIVF